MTMKPIKGSLRVRTSLFLIGLLLCALALLGGLTLRAVKDYQMGQMENDLVGKVKTVNLALKQIFLTTASDSEAKDVLKRSATGVLRSINPDRSLSTVIYALDGSAHNGSSLLTPDLLATVVKGQIVYQIHDESEDENQTYVDFLAPLYNGDTVIGVIRLKYFYSQYIQFYKNIQQMIFYTGGGVFVFSLLAALWYYGRLTTAILTLQKMVKGVKEGRYNNLDTLNRRDELGDLSHGIQDMAQTIESTLQKLHTEQAHLTLAVSKLKAMELEQRQFFGRITHEFKTPLSVINASNDLAEMYGDDEALKLSTRAQIRDEVQKLTAMVERSLEMARLSKYDFEMIKEEFDLDGLIRDAVSRLTVKGDKYDIQWHVALEPILYSGDPELMGQILVNLLDNAIKYNYNGGYIWVTLHKKEGLQIVIENTGEGISDVMRDRLFDAYAVDDTEAQTGETGTGLGLALVRHLVHLLGGRIQVDDGIAERQMRDLKGCRIVIDLS